MVVTSLIAVGAALLGTGFGYYLQGKARNAEHQLTIDRMVLQEQRAVASASDEALAGLELRAFHGPETASQLRNEWITQVRPKALLIDSEELTRRIEFIGELLLLAHQMAGSDGTWHYAVGTAVEDARAWLAAFLRRKEPPAPKSPSIEHVRSSISQNGARTIFVSLHAERIFREEEATRAECHPESLGI